MINKEANTNQNTSNDNPIDSWTGIRGLIDEILDLKKGVDKRATIEEIKNKKSMSGANAWMLMCSIMIASIGLDLDSPAVIIGAMLISPLMSPILGIGLGIGVNDRVVLKNSLKHFSVAIIIAVLTSLIYFGASPLSEVTDQISSRTEPTFLDILIAFFGGIAGIISIARKDLSTTLPGVAIATALMPPLCVTGWGLANGEWQMALSAFYLFFLNTFFVSLATYAIIRFLKFPYTQYVNKKEKRRNYMYIAFFSLLIIIPSLFIARKVINQVQTDVAIKNFIDEYIAEDKIYLDAYKYLDSDSINRLVFKVYGDQINNSKMDYYEEGLEKYEIDNTSIEIISTSEVKLDQLLKLESQVSGVEKIAFQLQTAKKEKNDQDLLIEQLKKQLSSMAVDSSSFTAISKEVKILFPEIEEIVLATGLKNDFDSIANNLPILIVKWPKNFNRRTKESNNEKILSFVKSRNQLETVEFMSN